MASTTAVAPHWRCTITKTASTHERSHAAETQTTDYVLQRLRTTLTRDGLILCDDMTSDILLKSSW